MFGLIFAGIFTLLCLFVLWSVGTVLLSPLFSLHAVIKNQRRMRVEMYMGDASQMQGLSGGELETLTGELQTFGFSHLGDLIFKMDYKADEELPKPPIADPCAAQDNEPKMVAETTTDGVGRIFAHPTHGCYATLVSVVAVSRFPPEMNRADSVNVAPFRTAILTISGNNEDSWGYATHNREVMPFSLLHRHPRQLSHRLIGASAAQLLETHLIERETVASRGGFQWDKVPTLEKNLEYESRGLRHIRSVYERATTLGTAWKIFTFRFGKHETWMGELPSR